MTGAKITKVAIIGRFQVLGNHHLDFLQQIMEKFPGLKKLFVIIGSSEKHDTFNNPFSGEERLEMVVPAIKMVMEKAKIRYSVHLVPDIMDTMDYANHVKSIVPGFDKDTIIFTENSYTYVCFEIRGFKIEKPQKRIHLSAVKIREMIAKDQDWRIYVPQTTIDFLQRDDRIQRIKRLYTKENKKMKEDESEGYI